MRILAIFAVLVVLTGCATTSFPRTQEEWATSYVTAASTQLSAGQSASAAQNIDNALLAPTGTPKVQAMFAKNPKGLDAYRASFGTAIAGITLSYQPALIYEMLMRAKSAGLITDEQAAELLVNLNQEVLARNLSGTIAFDLRDKLDVFPGLQTPTHQAILLERTLKVIPTDTSANRIVPIIQYVQRVGPTSLDGVRIEKMLPSLGLRRSELDEVAKAYPAFAATRKLATTIKVALRVRNGDRLFTEDIQQALQAKFRGVDWVTEAGSKVLVLSVEKIRHDERTLPESRETITYAQYQVNLLNAALLMPRNASYLYEVVSGGSEIEYGYVVDATADGKQVFDKLIRGTVGGVFRHCQNARIQNVFGGVSPADFMANEDQQQRCAGAAAKPMDQLRREVLAKVVEGVREVPAIRAVESME